MQNYKINQKVKFEYTELDSGLVVKGYGIVTFVTNFFRECYVDKPTTFYFIKIDYAENVPPDQHILFLSEHQVKPFNVS
jgi:hypothetical protein